MINEYGRDKSIPQLIMAVAADDIYAIVFFTAFIGLSKSGTFNAASLLNIPIGISGFSVGIGFGLLLTALFKKLHIRDTIKALVILGMSFLLTFYCQRCAFLEDLPSPSI